MKILILSVHPRTNSGYGQLTRRYIEIFKQIPDVELEVLSYFGCNFRDTYNGINIIPTWGGMLGDPSIIAYCKVHKPDLLFTTMDLFPLKHDTCKKVKAEGVKVASLLMVDAEPFQSPNIPVLAEVDYPICVMRWAKNQIPTDYASKSTYIPLPVDNDYYIMSQKQSRIAFNEFLGGNVLNDKSKLISVVSANVGDMENRKNFYSIMAGWQKYLEMSNTMNQYLYLHTDVRGVTSKGVDIKLLMMSNLKYTAEQASTILFPKQIRYFENDITTEELNVVYNASDIYLNPSFGEGAGMPSEESIAAGCSPLLTNFGASREIVVNTQLSTYKHLLDGEPIYVGHQSVRCNVSPSTVAEGIRNLLQNPVSLDDRIIAADKCQAEYGIENNIKLWTNFINKIKED